MRGAVQIRSARLDVEYALRYIFAMTHTFTTEIAVSWSDDDIAHMKEQRRYWARQEGDPDKATRKFAQRYVKAINACLRHMEGTGPTLFPEELHPQIKVAFCFTATPTRISFEDIYGAAM